MSCRTVSVSPVCQNRRRPSARTHPSASGHIAGVVNPPAADKYCYWSNAKNPKDPDAWFDGAKQQAGSWWPDWYKWLKKAAGPKVKARVPGDGKLKALEDTPGSYVKVRISQKANGEDKSV